MAIGRNLEDQAVLAVVAKDPRVRNSYRLYHALDHLFEAESINRALARLFDDELLFGTASWFCATERGREHARPLNPQQAAQYGHHWISVAGQIELNLSKLPAEWQPRDQPKDPAQPVARRAARPARGKGGTDG